MEASKETSVSIMATVELLQEALSTKAALARCDAWGPWRDAHAAALCAVASIVNAPTMDAATMSALFKGLNASIRRLKRGRPCEAPAVSDIVGRKTYAGLDSAAAAALDAATARVVAVVAGRLQARLTSEAYEASLAAITRTTAAATAGFANLRGGPGRRSAAKDAHSRALVEDAIRALEDSAATAQRWAHREAASFRHRAAALLDDAAFEAVPLQRVVALSTAAQKAATSLARQMGRHTGRCRAATGFLRANAEHDRRQQATVDAANKADAAIDAITAHPLLADAPQVLHAAHAVIAAAAVAAASVSAASHHPAPPPCSEPAASVDAPQRAASNKARHGRRSGKAATHAPTKAADSCAPTGGRADPSLDAPTADEMAATDGADGAGPLPPTLQGAAAADDACGCASACSVASGSPASHEPSSAGISAAPMTKKPDKKRFPSDSGADGPATPTCAAAPRSLAPCISWGSAAGRLSSAGAPSSRLGSVGCRSSCGGGGGCCLGTNGGCGCDGGVDTPADVAGMPSEGPSSSSGPAAQAETLSSPERGCEAGAGCVSPSSGLWDGLELDAGWQVVQPAAAPCGPEAVSRCASPFAAAAVGSAWACGDPCDGAAHEACSAPSGWAPSGGSGSRFEGPGAVHTSGCEGEGPPQAGFSGLGAGLFSGFDAAMFGYDLRGTGAPAAPSSFTAEGDNSARPDPLASGATPDHWVFGSPAAAPAPEAGFAPGFVAFDGTCDAPEPLADAAYSNAWAFDPSAAAAAPNAAPAPGLAAGAVFSDVPDPWAPAFQEAAAPGPEAAPGPGLFQPLGGNAPLRAEPLIDRLSSEGFALDPVGFLAARDELLSPWAPQRPTLKPMEGRPLLRANTGLVGRAFIEPITDDELAALVDGLRRGGGCDVAAVMAAAGAYFGVFDAICVVSALAPQQLAPAWGAAGVRQPAALLLSLMAALFSADGSNGAGFAVTRQVLIRDALPLAFAGTGLVCADLPAGASADDVAWRLAGVRGAAGAAALAAGTVIPWLQPEVGRAAAAALAGYAPDPQEQEALWEMTHAAGRQLRDSAPDALLPAPLLRLLSWAADCTCDAERAVRLASARQQAGREEVARQALAAMPADARAEFWRRFNHVIQAAQQQAAGQSAQPQPTAEAGTAGAQQLGGGGAQRGAAGPMVVVEEDEGAEAGAGRLPSGAAGGCAQPMALWRPARLAIAGPGARLLLTGPAAAAGGAPQHMQPQPSRGDSETLLQQVALEDRETDSHHQGSVNAAGKAATAGGLDRAAIAGLAAGTDGGLGQQRGGGVRLSSGAPSGEEGASFAAAAAAAATAALADTRRRSHRSTLARWGGGVAAAVCCGVLLALCRARRR